MPDSNLGEVIVDIPKDPIERHGQKDDATHSHEEKGVKKSLPNLSELTFVRLIDPVHIPSYLVEQMPERLFELETFYSYHKLSCLYQTAQGPQMNHIHLLYAIVHEKLRQVKGFVDMSADYLTNSLRINNFSFDKEYWQKGEAAKILLKKAKEVMRDLKFSRIVWVTKKAKFCEDNGFKRSKESIMIYEE